MDKLKEHNKLKAAMVEKGYNQKDMAKLIKASANSFNHKINGKRDFKETEINIIILELGGTYEEYFLPPGILRQH